MAAEIKIHGNGLRLFNRFFLIIVPNDELKLQVGGVYNCMIDCFGEMGKIECTRITQLELGQLDDRINELSDNLPEHREWYRRKGYFRTTKIQIGYFRFKRRTDEQFIKLLDKECKVIGLNLKPQATLF